MTDAERKAWRKIWAATPEAKKRDRDRHVTSAYKETARLRDLSPERKETARLRRASPEYKEVRKRRKATLRGRAQRLAFACGIPIEIPNRPMPDWCECCDGFAAKTLHFGHIHNGLNAGRFMGWECNGCNTGNGHKDRPEWHEQRAAYLRRPFQPGPINWVYPHKNDKRPAMMLAV